MKEFSNNKKVLCFGEVLWDILPQGRKIGGAPLNVAYHLDKLGMEVYLVSRIGMDASGIDIQKFIEKNGLACSILQSDPDYPTSTVQAEIGPEHEVAYRIIENVAWDFIEYDTALENLSKQADYLVYGSLIMRNSVSGKTLDRLIENLLIKVMDVNLRRSFYSKDVLYKLLVSADIAKMNEAELQIISEWFNCEYNNEEKMKALQKAFDINLLIVTCGDRGAYLLDNNKIYYESGHHVEVVDTIGSGDAFLAGFLSEYITDKSPPEALKTANAMGAFTAQRAAGCPDYEKEEINELTNQF